MSESWLRWWLQSGVGGGLLLGLVWLLMKWVSEPARRQRLGEAGVAAALLLALLSFAPAWLHLPVPSSWAEQAAPAPTRPPAPTEMVDSVEANPPDEFVPLIVWELERVADDRGSASDLALAAQPAPRMTEPFSHVEVSGLWSAHEVDLLVRVLFIAYAAAVLFALARWLLGSLVLARLLRQAEPAPAHVEWLFAQMASGLVRRPRLLVSRKLRVPLSCGLMRPTIVLTPELCAADAGPALRWVLAHELTHLERRDTWTCHLFALGQVLYFFVPWFWWLRRQVHLCQEYIADAVAVQEAGRVEDYAQFLLDLRAAPALPVYASGVSGNTSDLYRRVTMLLETSQRLERRCPLLWSVSAAGILCALAVVLAGFGLRAQAAPPVDEPGLSTAGAQAEPKKDKDADSRDEAKKALEKAREELKKALQELDDKARDLDQKPGDKKPGDKSERKPGDRFELKIQLSDDLENALKELDKALKDLPANAGAEETRKAIQKAMEEFRNRMRAVRPNVGGFPGGFPPPGVPGQAFRVWGVDRLAHTGGRLGISGSAPSPVLAEQLGLPKGQGLVIEQVQPESAAAKAGLKEHDILVELAGKPVPSDIQELAKMVEALKAKEPVDAIVLRKGKKETVKGITLAEAKDPFIQKFNVRIPGPPDFVVPRLAGDKGVMTTVFRTGERFTARHQEGSLVISLSGTVADGKSKLGAIHVQDGKDSNDYAALDKVPDRYRDKVKNLVDMVEKAQVKVETK